MAKQGFKVPPAQAAPPKEEPKKGFTLDFVNEQVDDLKGFEQITQETMAIPFVRILQKLSPQLNKQKPEYVEGAEEGQFFNTITKMVYGSSIRCIVLKFEHMYIEWRPERGGFVGYHSPEHAEQLAVDHTFGNWKTKDGNLLQETYAYLVLIEGHEREGVCVLSMGSSSIKVAKQWNRLMVTHIMENGKQARPYYLVWELKTEYMSNDKGDWYMPSVSFVSYIGKAQYEITQTERKLLPSRQVDYAQIVDQRKEDERAAEEGAGY